MFEGSKSVVISLFNGSVDSSSVVLLFCKVLADYVERNECMQDVIPHSPVTNFQFTSKNLFNIRIE